MQVVGGLVVAIVCLVGLVAGAVHGNTTARHYDSRASRAASALDVAYYDCIDRQVHSVVHQGEAVTLPWNLHSLQNFVNLVKASGAWLTIARRPGEATVSLTLQNHRGADSCLGTRVVARTVSGSGRGTVRTGSGASLPGTGQPPEQPL